MVGHPISFKDLQMKQGYLKVLLVSLIDWWQEYWVVLRDGTLFLSKIKGGKADQIIPLHASKLSDYSKDKSFQLEGRIPKPSNVIFRHDDDLILFEWFSAILKQKIIFEEVVEYMTSLP